MSDAMNFLFGNSRSMLETMLNEFVKSVEHSTKSLDESAKSFSRCADELIIVDEKIMNHSKTLAQAEYLLPIYKIMKGQLHQKMKSLHCFLQLLLQ
jgi:hypothetical protein